MSWQNLTLTVPTNLADDLESHLEAMGALSVSFVDAGDVPILEPAPGATPLWPEVTLTALFPESADLEPIVTSLQAEYGLAEKPSISSVPDKDWTRVWMDDFTPIRFGKRLWVCPSWCPAPDPGAVNLQLDPGLAFGTGTHPTTALCLEWLDQNLQPGVRVLDYGCGSGVLAIAALMLGAKEAWAVDIDPQALLATQENARRNHILDDHLHVTRPEELPAWEADIVIANILSGPLIALAGPICDHLKPGGQLLLSGILQEQTQDTASAYASRIHWTSSAFKDGWACLSGHLMNA